MHVSRETEFQAEGKACAKALGLEQPVECEGNKKTGEEETREAGAKELAPLRGSHPVDHSVERGISFCLTWGSCTSLHPQVSASHDTFYRQGCDS